MKKFNQIDRKWEEVKNSNLFLHHDLRVIHAMPTAGKTVLTGSLDGSQSNWLDTDVLFHLVTGKWANIDEIRRLANDGNPFMRHLDKVLEHTVCREAQMIQQLTGCRLITNMFFLPIDITFGRTADVMKKIFTERFYQRHPEMSARDKDRLNRNLNAIEQWCAGWMKWVEEHEGVEAYQLEEGEYLSTAFGVTPRFEGAANSDPYDDVVYAHARQILSQLHIEDVNNINAIIPPRHATRVNDFQVQVKQRKEKED